MHKNDLLGTPMRFRLRDLCDRVGGELRGDPEREIVAFAPIESAQVEHLTFVAQDKFAAALKSTQAGAVIVNEAVAHQADLASKTVWVHASPYLAYARVSQFMAAKREPRQSSGIHPTAVIAASSRVDPDANVGAYAVVGADCVIAAGVDIGTGCSVGDDVQIGAGTVLHPRATLYSGCRIGARVIIHSGAVIGADGFGFAPERGTWVKIIQTGRVTIGDDVEVGANTTIDRGALEDTVIEPGVKLDNQIQIAHNVHVGEHTAIAACVGIAGSTKIGRRCTIGGAAMLGGHLQIVDDVHIGGGTAVSRSIMQPGRYAGIFPFDTQRQWERNAAVVRNLADLRERVRALERALRESNLPPET